MFDNFRRAVAGVALLALLSGCGSPQPPVTKHQAITTNSDLPTNDLSYPSSYTNNPSIYYIGERAVLTFETNAPLDIPINGAKLNQPGLNWAVSVDGVVPAQRGTDFAVKTPQTDLDDPDIGYGRAMIELTTNYTARLKDGDLLTVSVDIANDAASRYQASYAGVFESIKLCTNEVTETLMFLRSNLVFNAGNELASRVLSIWNITDVLTNQLFRMPTNTLDSQVLDQANGADNDVGNLYNRIISTNSSVSDAYNTLQNYLLGLTLTKSLFFQSLLKHAPNDSRSQKASATRRFVLYTSDGYRAKYLNTRLPLNEIKAFPLPDNLVTEILGPKVVESFFVVALTVQNDDNQDRLINTGLVNAYGRAIVVPPDRGKSYAYSDTFTIPVQISPQSLQQVYAVVSDSKWKRSREWFFRSLEFSGELATAVATGFHGSHDLIEALSVYTGIGIPGLQKLWPDQVPTYLGNIVNFGMPELVKVPQHGSIGFKLLFFSKDNLQSLISDSTLYRVRNAAWPARTSDSIFNRPSERSLDRPLQFVVYIAFDTLEVPFETVVPPANGTVENRVSNLEQEANVISAELTDIHDQWVNSDDPTAGFSPLKIIRKGDWTTLDSDCSPANTGNKALNPTQTGIMSTCFNMLELLSPSTVNGTLVSPGIALITSLRLEAENIAVKIQAGNDSELYAASTTRLENELSDLRTKLDFFSLVAKQSTQLRPEQIDALRLQTNDSNFLSAFTDVANTIAPVVQTGTPLKLVNFTIPSPPPNPTQEAPPVVKTTEKPTSLPVVTNAPAGATNMPVKTNN